MADDEGDKVEVGDLFGIGDGEMDFEGNKEPEVVEAVGMDEENIDVPMVEADGEEGGKVAEATIGDELLGVGGFGEADKKEEVVEVVDGKSDEVKSVEKSEQVTVKEDDPAEVDEDQIRFETELEFVQCLASPGYLHYLAQNRFFEDKDFLDYLKYLQYWRLPSYAKFIVFPHCLYFLRLLQEEEFREALKRQDYYTFVHQQQGYYWQFGRSLKPRTEEPSTTEQVAPEEAAPVAM
ncbi:hypothetical protein NDN08_003257 [Rhodosorus marinus]|uniref:Mediator of RNA polymerase II transcription subunit 31 n=1 Tax=Rhodosorus marinus TaxID=101924 RepID=A0AAV8UW45_9RHOD|nr:hypothetical protein NDN08_003257 [Rhodosorus marinus]